MDSLELERLLLEIKEGTTSVADGLARVVEPGVVHLGHSRIDVDRESRCGHPEVIFGQGKSPSELLDIARTLVARHGRLIATRVAEEGAKLLIASIPGTRHHARARMVTLLPHDEPAGEGLIAVLSAGTSDGAVADEAAITARALGARVIELRDVGVAGLHRVMAHVDTLRDANAIVVVAGMDGALASVVGGLVSRPVIAVPTSVGYGAAFEGLAPLLTMLNSCAAGVSVVNIDNGFGAGYAAAQINRLAGAKR